MSKIISLSHTDLDGYGCQIIISNYFSTQNVSYMNSSYTKIDETIEYIAELGVNQNISVIFITDLNLSQNNINTLKPLLENTRIYVIDHHPVEFKEFKHSNFKFIWSEEFCGTYLTWKFLNKNNKLDRFKQFVSVIDSFDVWKKNDPNFTTGLLLNDEFWLTSNKNIFFTKYLTYSNFNPEALKSFNDAKDRYFQELESKKLIGSDGNIIFGFINKFNSHFTIQYPNFDIYINVYSYGLFSIRLKEENTNLRKYLLETFKTDKYINSGGHQTAFSFSFDINNDIPEQLRHLKLLIQLIKGYE
jgi:oligoribonuclease NrnB/cAMP/cGMP phosphodiesterase (DHH superfamily)